MSLKDDLNQTYDDYQCRKTARDQSRKEEAQRRNDADRELGRKHAVEDLDTIALTLKQRAALGFDSFELDIETTITSATSGYAQGYFDACAAYMHDNGIGLYTKRNGQHPSVTHSIFFYWR